MSGTILRGRVLTFVAEPQGAEDHDAYRYIEDGAVVIDGGKIIAVGEWSEALKLAAPKAEVIDHKGKLILPGFIDTHIHYPQMQVVGSYAKDLLEWLNTYTFIEEQRFGDEAHAARIASLFFDELVRYGTTTAAAYCTVHPQSAEAFFAEAEKRNMRMIAGKVMMDRNAPEALCDTPQRGYDDTKRLMEKWDGRGRLHYAITPRFALTSTHEQMEMCQDLAREFPDAYIQTHVNESLGEIAFAKELYPNLPDYVGIYEHYGLLGPKTLLGHCIHMTDREIEAMSETGAVAVFCPTSNLFIGSGLFDRQRMIEGNVRIGVATDIGGGTSYSMLRTLDEGYKVLQLKGQRLSPIESFYMMTLGNARALCLEHKIGSLEVGADADIVVLDAKAVPHMALKMEQVETLSEELFLLQTCGDDRVVVQTYIAGAAAKMKAA
ncbi:guanine deaminase [Pelagibacterium lentulum]|uniref:Guanine deaminase n=1 Tax=Pelagibacterium lentulum TaxID=2029865 RepID=A0A916R9I6_9HYPH|nr:guanine deaminase [Pelagibacterium lentulum]GGA44735.1 guanine deaminase [Pelagibacterium lentulum]